MITLYLSGGLGNQMFQYATAFALSRKNKTGLQISLAEFAAYPLRSYMLDRFQIDPQVKTVLQKPGKLFIYKEPHFHFDDMFFALKGNAKIKGYFQSPKYFEHFEKDIRRQFIPKHEIDTGIIEKMPIAVSVHMRRGDYVRDTKTNAIHGSLDKTYYKRAIDLMLRLYGVEIAFFIFSDDPDYAANFFDFCPKAHIMKGDPDQPVADMWAMSRCQHHIIANSSFSWWSAWLNPSQDKTVIAPRNWFSRLGLMKYNTMDLFPEGWIVL